MRIVRVKPLFQALLEDRSAGVQAADAGLAFHRTLAAIVETVVRDLRQETGIGTVALSGGCFQNRLLVGMVVDRLEASGVSVLTHRHVPCNDGGISLGQAAIALAAQGMAQG